MARTKARLGRGFDASFYPRGPTHPGHKMPALSKTHPAVRWTTSGLIALVILIPLAVIFWDTLIQTFGVAMGPAAAMILTALVVAYKRPLSLLYKANRWLAVVSLGALVFGCMAFFRTDTGILSESTLGGNVGVAIIGDQNSLGVLRLVGIGLAGVYLFAPVPSWRVARAGAGIMLTGTFLMLYALESLVKRAREYYTRRQVKQMLKRLAAPQVVRQSNRESTFLQKVLKKQRSQSFRMAGLGILRPTPKPLAQEPSSGGEPLTQEEKSLEEAITPKRLQDLLPGFGKTGLSNGSELPSPEILDSAKEAELTPADNQRRAVMIEEALASHGIEARVVQINPGPAVTQFGLEPGWFRKFKEVRERDENGKSKVDDHGNAVVRLEEVSRKRVRVDQITALDKDLALALAAPSIRIEAPVPGKSLVGIEVPNTSMGLVGLKEAVQSVDFQKALARSNIALALGKGSSGEMVADSLARMPHVLIAGATGSGKSVCITSMICCLIMHNPPEDVRFVIIDPKRVELMSFSTLPHLITPLVVDMDKAVGTLRWLTDEMDRRYKLMAAAAARNIDGYNKKVDASAKMPYLVVVIDELADLMNLASFDVEQYLTRLAQLGRATGIHLIVATQRPSVDVITGLIKANFPTRISFAVTSMMDSRVILDTVGAEKLLGRGDMLYLPSDAAKPKRLQGVYVSEQEVERIVYFWNQKRGSTKASTLVEEEDSRSERTGGYDETVGNGQRDEDPFLTRARRLAKGHSRVSASLLQRRLEIGYPKAAMLIDLLEKEGLVEPGEPGKSRKVVMEH